MKRYEQYKDSGVAWIGEIPAHWETVKPKYTVFLQKGTKPQELTDEDNGNLPYLTMDVLRDRANKTTMYPTSVNDLVKVGNGDILVLWDGANAGEVLFAKDGYLSSTMARFGFNTNRLDSRYWFYFLKGLEPILKEFAGGTTIPHLDSSKIMEEPYPIPSIDEQQAIVRYLDYKVAKIDKLIAENEAQVKELEKYRTAVISEVVTKGLNPNVPMRDSGIQWIGEIPAHWSVLKLKYCTTKIGSGITPTGGADVYQDNGILFLRSQNIYEDDLRLEDVVYISDEIDAQMSNSRVYYGDVLLNITGASIGRCRCFDRNVRANVNQHVCIIRPNKLKINYKYLQYILNSDLGQTLVKTGQTGANREGLTFEQIKNFVIPVCPICDQEEIVHRIDNKCHNIDKMLDSSKQNIAWLTQYKTALISEAVTGQIDVRDWQEK